MTTVQAEKIARRKLSLLQLAQELGNVSKACKLVGYSSWQQFYEISRCTPPASWLPCNPICW
jgi:molybdenum-dependent DNA-binding transcriptional regulator ModE